MSVPITSCSADSRLSSYLFGHVVVVVIAVQLICNLLQPFSHLTRTEVRMGRAELAQYIRETRRGSTNNRASKKVS